jgi:tetratricopeptide (TPR) repeat protein
VAPAQVVDFVPLLFVTVFLLRSIADFLSGYAFQRIGLGVTTDIRNELYGRILHQSSRFHADHPSGELVSRVINDAAWMMQESGADLDLALEYADRAVALDPNDPGIRDTRGMVHHRRGEPAKALADFDAALRAPGGDVAEIRWHRARALADAGSSGEAEAEARRLLDRADLDERVRSEIAAWLANR